MVFDLDFFTNYIRSEFSPSPKLETAVENLNDDNNCTKNSQINDGNEIHNKVKKERMIYNSQKNSKGRKKSRLDRLIDREFAMLDDRSKENKNYYRSSFLPPNKLHTPLKEKETNLKNHCKKSYRSSVHSGYNIKPKDGCQNVENKSISLQCGQANTTCNKLEKIDKKNNEKKSTLEKLRKRLKKDLQQINTTLNVFRCGKQENEVPKDLQLINDEKREKRVAAKKKELARLENLLSKLEMDFDSQKDLFSENDEELKTKITNKRPQKISVKEHTELQNKKQSIESVDQNQSRFAYDCHESNKCPSHVDECMPLKMILENFNDFVLKDCEFIYRNPVNKQYLIKIQQFDATSKESHVASSYNYNSEAKRGRQDDNDTCMGKLFLDFLSKLRNTSKETPGENIKDDTNCQRINCQSKNSKQNNTTYQKRVCQSRKLNKSQVHNCDSPEISVKTHTEERAQSTIRDGIEEIRFLSELWDEGKEDQPESLHTKLAKRDFYKKFLIFLRENKEELRKQYQQYRQNRNNNMGNGDSAESLYKNCHINQV